jgi:hypothetical protein
MLSKRFLLPLLLACAISGAATAFPQDDATVARADARVHEILDVSDYLDEVDRAMQMGRMGEYGKIKKSDLARAADAQNEIHALLDGRTDAASLDTEQRVQLLNAQELITAVLRSDEKSRKVCRLVAATGTRVGKAECMTVAQREKRNEQGSRDMREMQRLNCRPDQPLTYPGFKC